MPGREHQRQIVSYSQNNEESAILAACNGVGRFLDVGAWNATDKSNVRALYERGWSGVLVEPSPDPFAGLKAAYDGDPRITLLNVAVGLEPGMINMHVTADACSTSDPETYEKWRRIVNFTGVLQVPAITLEDIYERYGEFDMVSIDAEGVSVDLLHRLFDMGKSPKCIVVEHDDRTTEALSHATACGYAAVMVNGENIVLVKR